MNDKEGNIRMFGIKYYLEKRERERERDMRELKEKEEDLRENIS